MQRRSFLAGLAVAPFLAAVPAEASIFIQVVPAWEIKGFWKAKQKVILDWTSGNTGRPTVADVREAIEHWLALRGFRLPVKFQGKHTYELHGEDGETRSIDMDTTFHALDEHIDKHGQRVLELVWSASNHESGQLRRTLLWTS